VISRYEGGVSSKPGARIEDEITPGESDIINYADIYQARSGCRCITPFSCATRCTDRLSCPHRLADHVIISSNDHSNYTIDLVTGKQVGKLTQDWAINVGAPPHPSVDKGCTHPTDLHSAPPSARIDGCSRWSETRSIP
jgi:hypothetical protein